MAIRQSGCQWRPLDCEDREFDARLAQPRYDTDVRSGKTAFNIFETKGVIDCDRLTDIKKQAGSLLTDNPRSDGST